MPIVFLNEIFNIFTNIFHSRVILIYTHFLLNLIENILCLFLLLNSVLLILRFMEFTRLNDFDGVKENLTTVYFCITRCEKNIIHQYFLHFSMIFYCNHNFEEFCLIFIWSVLQFCWVHVSSHGIFMFS